MKNYSQLTIKYLQHQKKRTILTIIGIILSVALITAVGSLLKCVQATTIKAEKELCGNYHVMFQGLSYEQFNKLSKNIKIKDIFKTQNEGSLIQQNNQNITFDLISYDSKALEQLPIELKNGRLPKNNTEIILDDFLAKKNKNIKIGNSISFINQNNKITKQCKYKIVGLIDSTSSENNIIITKYTTSIKEQKNITAFVNMKSIKDINTTSKTIANNINCDIENIQTNNDLLRVLRQTSNNTLSPEERAVYLIFTLLILTSMIAVIYNAFNISVVERISQYGIIRCIGATPKQIKKLVLKEALILSMISIPIGAISGLIICKLILIAISYVGKKEYSFIFVISPQIILISSILGFVTVILSANVPAKLASNITALETLKNTFNIKVKQIKNFKKRHWFLKPLGIEGQLAWTSLKRNNKRFKITIFSITISIILFITFSAFLDITLSEDIKQSKQELSNFYIYNNTQGITQDEYKEICQFPGVKVAYKNSSELISVTIPEKKYNKKYNKKFNSLLEIQKKEGNVIIDKCSLINYGNDKKVIQSLKSLLKKGDVNIEKMNKENGVLLVNSITSNNNIKKTSLDVTNLSIGDKIDYTFKDKKGNITTRSLKVLGILKKDSFNDTNRLSLITSDKVFKNITGNKSFNIVTLKLAKNIKRNQLLKFVANKNYNFFDESKEIKKKYQLIFLLYLLVYCFIFVISLIGSLNINNTMSNNLSLRTKELTLLKAIGMSEFDIKKMIIYECIYYGIIGTFFGGIIGTSISYMLYKEMLSVYNNVQWLIPYNKIIIASISTILIALISAYAPLKRINKSIIIDNLS